MLKNANILHALPVEICSKASSTMVKIPLSKRRFTCRWQVFSSSFESKNVQNLWMMQTFC